eukprot:1867650-Pleurochrysis_carterae.AAC.1
MASSCPTAPLSSDASGSLDLLVAAVKSAVRAATEPEQIVDVLSAVRCILVPAIHEQEMSDTAHPALVQRLRSFLELSQASRTESLNIFLHRHHQHWCALLLGPIARDWAAALTQKQLHELMYSHFVNSPPRDALEAIAAALQPTSGDRGGQQIDRHQASICSAILLLLCEQRRMHALFLEMLETKTTSTKRAIQKALSAEDDALVSLLCALPDRLANRLQVQPP